MCVCVGYVTEFVVDFTISLDRHGLMSRGFWLAQISSRNQDFHQDIFKLIVIYLLQLTKNKTTTFTNCYPGNVVISNIRPYAITQEERLFTRPQQVSSNRPKNGFYAKKTPLFKLGVSNYTPFPFPKLTDRLTNTPSRGETSSSARSKSKPTGFTFFKKCRFPTVSSRIYLRGLSRTPP